MNNEEKEMISQMVDLMKKDDLQIIKGFNTVDRKKLNDITKKVNCVFKYVITDSISDTKKIDKSSSGIYRRTNGINVKTSW